ncbi:hypothetical protein PG2083B_1669 [Bifidobacterium pseudolongum subsp. globosum]|nr:hypothetical protein PG2083B_1669 [Bifidobacterium pseudolongum subsp. globosum]
MDTSRKKTTLFALTFVAFIAAKVLVLNLPPKYFYDNNRIVSMVNRDGALSSWTGSYQTTAEVFDFINILKLNSMLEWSIVLGLIFTTFISIFIFTNCEFDFYQELFWLCCIVLLNIYVFNIGKDLIQFCFFFTSFLIAKSNLSTSIRVISISILFYIESVYFRSYFILVVVFFVAIIILTMKMRSNNTKAKPRTYYFYILLTVYVFLIMSSVLFPEQYEDVTNVRAGVNDGREGSADAATLISNVIPGNSLLIALINYPINALRMLIPLELLIKGVAYIPFVVFQLFATFYLVQYSKGILNKSITGSHNYIIYSIYLSFLLTSFFFEPDFGSWVRHEMAAFPVFQFLFFSKYCHITINIKRNTIKSISLQAQEAQKHLRKIL